MIEETPTTDPHKRVPQILQWVIEDQLAYTEDAGRLLTERELEVDASMEHLTVSQYTVGAVLDDGELAVLKCCIDKHGMRYNFPLGKIDEEDWFWNPACDLEFDVQA